jgi:hypothetical protein
LANQFTFVCACAVSTRSAAWWQLAFLPLKAVRLSDPWAKRTHRLATRSGVAPSPATRTLMAALTA